MPCPPASAASSRNRPWEGAGALGVHLLLPMTTLLTDLQRQCLGPGPTERRPLRCVDRGVAAPAAPAAPAAATATPGDRPVWLAEQAPAAAAATPAGCRPIWGRPGSKHEHTHKRPDPACPNGWTIRRPRPKPEPAEALAVVSKGCCRRLRRANCIPQWRVNRTTKHRLVFIRKYTTAAAADPDPWPLALRQPPTEPASAVEHAVWRHGFAKQQQQSRRPRPDF
jgi:hypothetical protein